MVAHPSSRPPPRGGESYNEQREAITRFLLSVQGQRGAQRYGLPPHPDANVAYGFISYAFDQDFSNEIRWGTYNSWGTILNHTLREYKRLMRQRRTRYTRAQAEDVAGLIMMTARRRYNLRRTAGRTIARTLQPIILNAVAWDPTPQFTQPNWLAPILPNPNALRGRAYRQHRAQMAAQGNFA